MSNRPTTLLKDGTLYWVLSVYDASGVLVDADSTPSVAVRKNGSATTESVTVTKRGSSTGLYDCSLNPSLEAEGDTFHLEEELDISSVTYNNTWSVVVTEPMITSTEVSTAVWDVPTSSYLGAGTFGLRFSALNTTTPDNTSITAIKTVTDQMVFTIANELDCNAVSGGGGDATAANQAAISNAIASLNDFDPASDDVAVVTTVSNMRGTDNANTVVPDNAGVSANGNAIAALNDFNPATDTVITDTASRNASKADVSGLATSSEVANVDSAVAVVDTVVDAIKVTTDKLDTALVLDGSVYQYTVNALENAPSGGGGGGDATAANQTTIINAISNLNDFDPSSDAVANVTLVATTTTNTDMRGTDGANTIAPDNAGITSNGTAISNVDTVVDLIKVDTTGIVATTDKLDTALILDGSVYQYTVNALENAPSGGGGGGSATLAKQNEIIADIAALNDFNPATDSVANVTDVATTAVCVSNSDMRGTDGANTVAPDNAGISSNGTALATTTKTGVQYTATAQSGDTIQVTLS